MEDNINKIQELYKEKEDKRNQGVIKENEVILIKPYECYSARMWTDFGLGLGLGP